MCPSNIFKVPLRVKKREPVSVPKRLGAQPNETNNKDEFFWDLIIYPENSSFTFKSKLYLLWWNAKMVPSPKSQDKLALLEDFYPMAWRPPGTLPHTLSSNTLVWKAWGRRKEHGARNQLRLGYWFRVNSITIGWMASVSRAVSERSAAWVNAWLTWMQESQGSAERNCLGWLLQWGRKAHAMHRRWKLGAGEDAESQARHWFQSYASQSLVQLHLFYN